jgi:hypothetical protein
VLALGAGTRAQKPASPDLSALLWRVGDQVERFYQRAQSVVCRETVRLQTLGADLLSDGSHVRQLVYELRVGWEPPAGGGVPEASVMRELVSVNNRPPRPRDKPGCMDPKSVSPEPLAMLLPTEQDEYRFTWAGRRRVDGRQAVLLDFRPIAQGAPQIVWKDDCVSVSLPGRFRGRVWVDEETADVLRIDESLTGMFDFRVPREHRKPGVADHMTIERADSSIRYRRVAFDDPEETLMLPASIDTVTIFRNSGAPRVRKTQQFSNYRRFITGGRILP